jgi:type III restriction enzyme
MPPIKFKFDHNQEHQIVAINSLIKLFDKLPKGYTEFQLGEEIIPNLPFEESIDEDVLLANLYGIQEENQIDDKNNCLDVDDGLILEGVGNESWRYPVFTVEMETGTGKTYVYLRTIYELKKLYGFRKFIIVVPSIAIYEGVLKAIEMTREHFKTLYNNEYLSVIDYDSAEISKLRDFAISQFLQVMVITMAAFNKSSNNIYKRTEKLPGEKLPIQYIQETRPILILDESQNYTSEKSKEALRTLHPLLAIKYSATPGYKVQTDGDGDIKFDNLLYRLTPVQAFKSNLVKRIQVCGITEQFNFNQQFSIVLRKIHTDLTADMVLIANNRGQFVEKEYTLKKNDDLEDRTKNDRYRGFKIEEINRREQKVSFVNGYTISLQTAQALTPSKEELFKIQIEETVKFHLERQSELLDKGIKVLSLFFIDRVANYIEEDGIVKKLFDAAFEKFKSEYKFFKNKKAEEVREAYFAKKKTKEGEIVIDTEGKNEAERRAEKAAFELIMRDKERLLSLDEKVCFVFAHSALKEGWDNPNVFQICTLRDTQSEMRKRQEIGRGMRLCVNQNGERVMDPDINVLTVVANESYESFCNGLQNEYAETGEVAPQKPSNARRSPAKRNDNVYKSSDFDNFWKKLTRKTTYEIKINTEEIINNILARFSKEHTPPPQILIKKGKYVITHIEIKLYSISRNKATLEVNIDDTMGNKFKRTEEFKLHDDLAKLLRDDRLRGFKIIDIKDDSDNKEVIFANEQALRKDDPISFDTETGQRIDFRTVVEATTQYPVFNLIERTQKETLLTRPTIFKIYNSLSEERRQQIFSNPEGFANTFIFVIKEVLADHVAMNIQYNIGQDFETFDKKYMFPKEKGYPQKEIIQGSDRSLYNLIQIDSDIEKRFVEDHLNRDGRIILYFKFPMHFRVNVPQIIGNYVPDWGIIRLTEDGTYKLELVRETKATPYENLLQFTNEKRKIWCAEKHFKQLGISYRKIAPEEFHRWWKIETEEQIELTVDRILREIEIIESIEENLKYKEYLPVYSLAAACGKYGEGQDIESKGWVKVQGKKLDESMFVAQAIGKSMEPKISDGAYCLFRAKPAGTRNNKILLVQYREISDPEIGGAFTLKKYNSEKVYKEDGSWRHVRITLSPLNPNYKPMIYEDPREDFESDFQVIAEFVNVL